MTNLNIYPLNSHSYPSKWLAELFCPYWFIRIKSFERRSTQMNNGQTIYKKRTLTHHLQQPAQETNLLPTANHRGSQSALPQTGRKPDCYLQWQSRKLSNNFVTTSSKMARAWLINNTFPNFYYCFQVRINQRKPNRHLPWSHSIPYFCSLPPASPGQQPPIRAYLKPSLLYTLKISFTFACFWISAKSKWWWLATLLGQTWNK